MPIYEFECGECGERFELLTAADAARPSCPACGAGGCERRMSAFGLSRQLTPSQQRRLEDRRGTDRDGARQRFKSNLDKQRGRQGRGGAGT